MQRYRRAGHCESGMKTQKFTEQFEAILKHAAELAERHANATLLVLLDGPTDWNKLRAATGEAKTIVAADGSEILEGASQADLIPLAFDMANAPVYDRLAQALLEAVADEFVQPGGHVVAVYSGFEPGEVDSLSVISLTEHFSRLTVRDLKQLETRVPLDTLQAVVNLAVEIGREGREGRPVGTMFVVGDERKVLSKSYPQVFDPFKGYNRNERNLKSPRVREQIKELSQLDGAFIVEGDGTVASGARYVDANADGITLSKGLGARHWAAAAISRVTNAIAVTVSESNGTVRLFQNGQVILRIEPSLRRPMKLKEFDYERPESGGA